jgi:hypothetical protein
MTPILALRHPPTRGDDQPFLDRLAHLARSATVRPPSLRLPEHFLAFP